MEGRDVAVVSRDLNMRVKCDAFGLECHDYQPQKVIRSVEKLYDGTETLEVNEKFIDQFYANEDVFLPDDIKTSL